MQNSDRCSTCNVGNNGGKVNKPSSSNNTDGIYNGSKHICGAHTDRKNGKGSSPRFSPLLRATAVVFWLAVWQFGSSMLIFLAGLKQIPVHLYEAATVDGIGGWAKFTKITLPMLTPTIFFNLINQLINGFMAFTQSFIITEGKPLNSTLFYVVYMYQNSFKFNKLGYGCAMAWFMVLVVGTLTALIFFTQKKWVYYEAEK